MTHAPEVEIKLVATPAMLEQLRRADSLSGESRHRNFETAYYDTADRRLARARLALRIRSDAGKSEITLKRAPAAKAIARDEWNAPLEGDALDLGALPPEAARYVIKAAKGADLLPVFRLSVAREIRVMHFGRSSIEVAFDSGRLTAAGGDVEICELELELVSGKAADLLGLALTLPLGPELRWSTDSKSARGYRLADDETPVAARARIIRLPANAGTRAALRRIVWACIGHVLANEDLVVRAGFAEALHQMRVALRRLRVALRLGHELLAEADAAVLDAECAAALSTLSTARDLDVILAKLGTVRREGGIAADLVPALEAERVQAYAEAATLIRSTAFQRLLVQAVLWAECLGTARPDDMPLPIASRALLKTWRRKLRSGARNLAEASPEARHRIRIRLKRLRYATEFFASLHDDAARERVDRMRLDALSEAQDHLGDLNDLDVAASLAPRLRGDPLRRAAIVEAVAAHARRRRKEAPVLLAKAQRAVDIALARRRDLTS